MGTTFGENLKKWRETASISQAELARRIDVSPTWVSNLERDFSPSAKDGKPQPSVEVCDKIARALNVSVIEVRLAAGYAPQSARDDTIEEALNSIAYFDRKGLGEEEKERIRPTLEMLDREIDRLGIHATKGARQMQIVDEVLEGLPKKADSNSEPWIVRVALRLEITGAAKQVGRVRAAIERYYLQRYAMRKLKDGGYEIALPYEDKADVKRRINLLLEEIEKEASRDNCVVETEIQMSDEDRHTVVVN